MKSFKRLIIIVITAMLTLIIAVNLLFVLKGKEEKDREYMVEISRMVSEMEVQKLTVADVDSAKYPHVKRVFLCSDENDLTAKSKYEYCIRKVGEELYRFEYVTNDRKDMSLLFVVDMGMFLLFVLVIGVLGYVYRQVIRPFGQMEQIPYQLAKGNLSLELPENKSRFLGKYIWGTNMLRESIEEKRKKELEMHREKKTLLLSLTHDIKTPLSVIKLNAQALSKGLYQEKERQMEAAGSIVLKADEIEGYVTKMVSAAREDFLSFEVREEEFYLSDVVEKLREYYAGKLRLRKTSFVVEEYQDCILRGDSERLIEVLQNLMENAIKYGDGEQITISFDKEEDCRLITVANTGFGVNPAELPHLFDSFYRGSNVGNESGSGLGLYICRCLMNRMNGDIFVKQSYDKFAVTVVVRE